MSDTQTVETVGGEPRNGDGDPDALKVHAVWPGNSIRGEVVALTYKDHWLVFQRQQQNVTVWEVFKDPIKIHGKYRKLWQGRPCKTKFKAAGTYMYTSTYYDSTLKKYMPRGSHEEQGKKIATFDLDTEELWYEIIKDPLFHLRLALI
jgi:hypothetical protein